VLILTLSTGVEPSDWLRPQDFYIARQQGVMQVFISEIRLL